VDEVHEAVVVPTNHMELPAPVLDDVSAYDATNLNIHQAALKDKIESIYLMNNSRYRLPRLTWNKKLKKLLLDANVAVKCVNTIDITETGSLLYAKAVVVFETFGYKVGKFGGTTQSMCKDQSPPWEYRLTKKVESLRSDLSRLEEIRAGRLQQNQLRTNLFFKYKVPQISIGEVIEGMK